MILGSTHWAGGSPILTPPETLNGQGGQLPRTNAVRPTLWDTLDRENPGVGLMIWIKPGSLQWAWKKLRVITSSIFG